LVARTWPVTARDQLKQHQRFHASINTNHASLTYITAFCRGAYCTIDQDWRERELLHGEQAIHMAYHSLLMWPGLVLMLWQPGHEPQLLVLTTRPTTEGPGLFREYHSINHGVHVDIRRYRYMRAVPRRLL